MMLTRRTALALAAAMAVSPAPALALSAADRALVDRAVDHLQSMKSVKGRFVQTDARGTRTQGTIYLKRPGRARFAYDPPSGLTVVSDGAQVSVADKRLKTFDRYPLSATPLALFLAKEIRLDRGVEVIRVSKLADGFSVTAQDGGRKTRGTITLDFADSPMRLLGWTVTDAQGSATRVRLVDLAPANLDAGLFEMEDPRPSRGRSGKM